MRRKASLTGSLFYCVTHLFFTYFNFHYFYNTLKERKMKHTLYVDRKVVTWLRTEIEVEADSLREAVEKFSEPDSWGADVELKNIHELETLRENISPRDNRYNATIEVYVPGHNEPVWNNLDNQFTEPQAKKSDANAA